MTPRNILLGVYSGLAGGVVFGAMMGAMGMLPMVGRGDRRGFRPIFLTL